MADKHDWEREQKKIKKGTFHLMPRVSATFGNNVPLSASMGNFVKNRSAGRLGETRRLVVIFN
jgi:hypothetical protein